MYEGKWWMQGKLNYFLLIVFCFISPSRIFHLCMDNTFDGERLCMGLWSAPVWIVEKDLYYFISALTQDLSKQGRSHSKDSHIYL